MVTLSSVAARQYLSGPQCNLPSGSNKLLCSVPPQNTISHVKAVLCLRWEWKSALYQWCRYNNFRLLSACSLITYMVRSSNRSSYFFGDCCLQANRQRCHSSLYYGCSGSGRREWVRCFSVQESNSQELCPCWCFVNATRVCYACMALANHARTCSPKAVSAEHKVTREPGLSQPFTSDPYLPTRTGWTTFARDLSPVLQLKVTGPNCGSFFLPNEHETDAESR